MFCQPVSAYDQNGKLQHVISMKINNAYMSTDGGATRQEIDPGRGTVPLIIDGRTVVPIRAIVESMGGTVGWDDATQQITISVNGHNISMWLNQKNLTVDGKSQTMDVAPVSINSRTMVPIRFVAENAGCVVQWEDSTKQIFIVYNTNAAPLWVDETKNNPNALFYLGMTMDYYRNTANAVSKLHADSQGSDYVDAPPMFFNFPNGKADIIRWDDTSKVNIPNVHGFGYRTTLNDVEKALGRPIAACAQDICFIFLYQTGSQYTEYYAYVEGPHLLNAINVTSSLDNCIANPDYNDYADIEARISGN